jgi:hypothetical protein
MSFLCTGKRLGACAAASLAASCLPAPTVPEATRAEALIQEACQAGGREDPGAAYYLALAERELARARLLVRVRDAAGARGWARRAAADGDVARMLALEVAVRGAAARTEADASALSRALDEGRSTETP